MLINFFFLPGFSFTETNDSQGSRERDHLFFHSTTSTRWRTFRLLFFNIDGEMTITYSLLHCLYLPGCYSMRFTTLSNYYLIDWWYDVNFLFVCRVVDFIQGFCYCYLTQETGGLELASTIILMLQANQLTKCASLPKFLNTLIY